MSRWFPKGWCQSIYLVKAVQILRRWRIKIEEDKCAPEGKIEKCIFIFDFVKTELCTFNDTSLKELCTLNF